MKLKQLSFNLGILLFALSTCTNNTYAQKKWKGDGNVVKEERTVDAFKQLELSGVFNAQLSQGAKEKVVIETDQNLQKLIETVNKNDKLIIKTKEEFKKRKSTKINVYVTVTDINYLEIGGVGKISCASRLTLDNLELEIFGVGNTNLELDCEMLNAEISSVGNTELVGEVETAFIENSGVGNLNAFDLRVQKLNLENSGIGKAKVYAEKEISVENSGIGGLQYKGNAVIKDFESSGIGKIKQIDN